MLKVKDSNPGGAYCITNYNKKILFLALHCTFADKNLNSQKLYMFFCTCTKNLDFWKVDEVNVPCSCGRADMSAGCRLSFIVHSLKLEARKHALLLAPLRAHVP